jgi:hypothetical protein
MMADWMPFSTAGNILDLANLNLGATLTSHGVQKIDHDHILESHGG